MTSVGFGGKPHPRRFLFGGRFLFIITLQARQGAEGGFECEQYSLQVHWQVGWNLEHEGGV